MVKKRIKRKSSEKITGFWARVEHFNSQLIPYALAALLFIIVFELFIHTENQALESVVVILDYLVIAIFVIDLIFLAIRARSVRFFFRNYWLDILAVLPLALAFNVVGKIYRAIASAGEITIGQAIFHESLEVSKGISKSSRFAKYLKIAARGTRVITKSRFFTKLRHHR